MNTTNTNILNSIHIDSLYKKNNQNINNDLYQNPINKINSEFSLFDKDNEKKKIIPDYKFFDFSENNNNISSDFNFPRHNFIHNSSLNNLYLQDPYNPLFHENNYGYKQFPPKSFANSLNRISSITNLNNMNSFNNLNNINYTPPKMSIFDHNLYHNMNPGLNSMTNINNAINSINNLNNINNAMNNINSVNTLLSPPPNTFHLPMPNTQQIIHTAVNDKSNNPNVNNNNFTFSNVLNLNNNSINTETDKNNSTLSMFNKKRKRDIKNNKLVFISENNKKEIKEKEKENVKKENNNNTNNINTSNTNEIITSIIIETSQSNEINSEKDRKPRGSKYRGVSRNGNQWQVLIMVNKKKRYVGSYSLEEEAARAYDKVALQNHGSKAKTNFDYTKQQVEEILASPQLLKLY